MNTKNRYWSIWFIKQKICRHLKFLSFQDWNCIYLCENNKMIHKLLSSLQDIVSSLIQIRKASVLHFVKILYLIEVTTMTRKTLVRLHIILNWCIFSIHCITQLIRNEPKQTYLALAMNKCLHKMSISRKFIASFAHDNTHTYSPFHLKHNHCATKKFYKKELFVNFIHNTDIIWYSDGLIIRYLTTGQQ